MTRLFVFTLAWVCAYASSAQYAPELLSLYYQGKYSSVTNVLVDDELLEPEALFIIANAFHKLEDFESALMYYEKCEQQASDLDDYFLNRAICEVSVGDLESAERHLFLHEDFVGEHPMIHYYFAAIDFELMEYKSSLATIDMALELDQEYFEAWYLKGAIYVETGKYEKAAECFSKVLEINPSHAQTELNLAISHMYLKDYDKAFELFDYIIANYPELEAEALFYKGESNFYLHNTEEACANWKDAALLGDEYAAKNVKLVCEKGKASKHKPRKITRMAL